MIGRLVRFLLPWAIFALIAVLLVIAWTEYQRSESRSSVVIPTDTLTGAVAESDQRTSGAPNENTAVPTNRSRLAGERPSRQVGAPLSPSAEGGVGAFQVESAATVSSPSPSARPIPKVAGMGTGNPRAGSPEPSAVHRPSAKPLPVTRPKAPAAVRSPSVPSPAITSQLPTTPKLVAPGASACPSPCAVAVGGTFSFGGLHPILESWYVGVASGIASWMGEGYGSGYLALPIGPGFRVRICGPGGCAEMVSNDAGPALHMQRAPYNRVADVAVVVWEQICGVSRRYGLCPVDLSVLGRA